MKKVALFILCFATYFNIFAQRFENLSKYMPFGVSIEGNIDNAFKLHNADNINITLNKPFSYNIGLFYEFNRCNRWSCIVGLNYNNFSLYDFKIDGDNTREYSDRDSYISTSIFLQYKKDITEKIFANLKVGLDVNLNGLNSYYYLNDVKTFENYSFTMEGSYFNRDVEIYRLIVGAGAIFDCKYFLLGADVLYTLLAPCRTGFDYNLTETTVQNSGTIKHEGRYLGIKLSFYPRKLNRYL